MAARACGAATAATAAVATLRQSKLCGFVWYIHRQQSDVQQQSYEAQAIGTLGIYELELCASVPLKTLNTAINSVAVDSWQQRHRASQHLQEQSVHKVLGGMERSRETGQLRKERGGSTAAAVVPLRRGAMINPLPFGHMEKCSSQSKRKEDGTSMYTWHLVPGILYVVHATAVVPHAPGTSKTAIYSCILGWVYCYSSSLDYESVRRTSVIQNCAAFLAATAAAVSVLISILILILTLVHCCCCT